MLEDHIRTTHPVTAKGKIVRLDDCIAVLDTEHGEALLDVGTDFDLRLEVGDKLEIEDAGFYILNCRIVAVIDEKTSIILNGWQVSFKDTT